MSWNFASFTCNCVLCSSCCNSSSISSPAMTCHRIPCDPWCDPWCDPLVPLVSRCGLPRGLLRPLLLTFFRGAGIISALASLFLDPRITVCPLHWAPYLQTPALQYAHPDPRSNANTFRSLCLKSILSRSVCRPLQPVPCLHAKPKSQSSPIPVATA